MQSKIYRERYRDGEYQQVWDELVALGDAVHAEPLYSDALNVARETMQRVNTNVETVIARLKTLGYRFADPNGVHIPSPPDMPERINRLEAIGGTLPLSLRAWYEVVGSVNFMGDHPTLASYAPEKTSKVRRPAVSLIEQGQLGAQMARRYEAFCKERGFSLTDREAQRQFREKYPTEHAALRRAADAEAPPIINSDPLVVDPLPALHDSRRAWEDFLGLHDDTHRGYPACTIAPDVYHKANVSGGEPYEMALSNPAADGILLGEPHRCQDRN